ncbi:hypothetical protein SODALDRAFT_205837 [Sodiomyces alkalinus F11]|uniref:Uncharacterized protein n=1 Tax=Sodiomyces alkalinus (strain CBS 110278 / VKM F-3762 / F11) TaxID=1314773 RepID=A0A3N2PQI8_SODAK|nr:hypothetical protein SODALDRAFT_205837 [Sodiomyces alkalinus F11]ROT36724.1 hypothetical protein SODALDRAFT_205837 [Sodiomyces alkalinus F11]
MAPNPNHRTPPRPRTVTLGESCLICHRSSSSWPLITVIVASASVAVLGHGSVSPASAMNKQVNSHSMKPNPPPQDER